MARQALVILLIVVSFGIFVPWYKGFALLSPPILAAYAFVAVLFVAPAAAESFANQPNSDSRAGLLQRMALMVAFGWGIAVLILFTALVTLNVMFRQGGQVIGPPFSFLSAVLLFSLTASAAVAGLCAFLARRFPAKVVKTALRIAFLLLLLTFAFGSRFLPDRWEIFWSEHTTRRALADLAWRGSAVCAIVTALLLIPVLRKPTAPSN